MSTVANQFIHAITHGSVNWTWSSNSPQELKTIANDVYNGCFDSNHKSFTLTINIIDQRRISNYMRLFGTVPIEHRARLLNDIVIYYVLSIFARCTSNGCVIDQTCHPIDHMLARMWLVGCVSKTHPMHGVIPGLTGIVVEPFDHDGMERATQFFGKLTAFIDELYKMLPQN